MEKLEACIKWLRENDGFVDERVEFKHNTNTGISAHVKDSVATDQPLIRVPENLLLTNEKAQEAFQLGIEAINKDYPNSLLQLYVAKLKFEEDAGSFFKPYIDMLPLQLEQPYFWDANDLQLLKGTDIYLVMKQHLPKLLQEWTSLLQKLKIAPSDDLAKLHAPDVDLFDYLQKCPPEASKVSWTSFSSYVWAAGIFASRAFPKIALTNRCLSINEAFLYPIVDLLNHNNDTKVKWYSENGQMCFVTQERLQSGDELFNNYGNKSNEDLLLSYGFVQDNNQYEDSRLTLRLDEQLLSEAVLHGVALTDERVADNCVQFKLTKKCLLPENLVQLFAYLHKLKSEEGINLRNTLEGSDGLQSILMQKVEFFRNRFKIDASNKRRRTLRKYFDSQRKMFQAGVESLQKRQKEIVKSNSPFMTSFKSIYKSDKKFANSLLLVFGVTKFDDLITKDCTRDALLLWIVRISNKEAYPRKLEFEVPQFIYDTFQEVSSTIVVERHDVMEMMPFYKKMFPSLSEKIPEVFSEGNWGIRQFIVADTVLDRLVWTRKLTQEPFFIKKHPMGL